MGERATFVILGGTGDLAKKKLFPSLYNLFEKGKLEDFDIVGTSRHEYSDEDYRKEVGEHVRDEEGWEEFSAHIRFCQLDFYEESDYRVLGERLDECCDHRLFYLATLPQHFETITKNLSKHGLVNDESKVLYEKPFGDDLESAKELNECIHAAFPEGKVYRVDHYLDKELIGNMNILRFTNVTMQPLWHGDYVDHIEIVMSEDFGVEDRGEFYDKYGAIKDVFQNHLLQLLALTTMEEPEKFDAECIRDEKVKLLGQVEVEEVITGQYEGYRQEEGVDDESNTETFFAAKLSIDNKRWMGVPIYVTSGKNLAENRVQVHMQFKNTPCDLFEGVCPLIENNLVINIKPEESIYMTINTKVPGEMNTTTSKMEFCYSCQHGINTPAAYENLLYEAVQGRQTSFVRSDEIEAEWKIVDNIKKPEPFTYPRGEFPEQAREFIRRDGKSWNDL